MQTARSAPRSPQPRHIARCCCAALVCMSLAALCPSPADASSLDLFGLGARGSAMGGAMTAAADDYTAVYYNLAALTEVEAGMGLGMILAADNVRIRLKARPNGYDLPDRGPTSAAIPSRYRLRARSDTDDLTNTYGFFVGAVGSFGIKRLRVGVLAYLPVNRLGLQATHYADERAQYFSNRLHFELLSDTTQHQVIAVGGAWQLLDTLSLGVGLSFLPRTDGTNFVYLDNPTDQSQADFILANEQGGQVAPHAGILFKPTDRIKLGLSYRGELFFPFELQNEIQIRGFQEQDDTFPVFQDIKAVVNYTPHQITLGVGYKGDNTTVAVDAQYALWSRYLNHQGQRVDTFDDTISYKLGVEWRAASHAHLRGGFGFTPTPVLPQTGRTNYVDNDRLHLSLGTGHPIRLLGYDVELAWAGYLHVLLPNDTNKTPQDSYPDCAPGVDQLCDELPDDLTDPTTGALIPEYQGLQTGNPGFPGFASHGILYGATLDARWTF